MIKEANRSSGFGKRGVVQVAAPQAASEPTDAKTSANSAKLIGGSLAVCAVVGLLAAGTGGGGGGLLGGLLGGMLGKHLADRSAANAAAKTTAANTTVNRGGFGSTGSSTHFSSGS